MIKTLQLFAVAAVPCPHCKAKIGEPCFSDTTGRKWKSDTHTARRLAARPLRLKEQRKQRDRDAGRTRLLEELWTALKLNDKDALARAIHALRTGEANGHDHSSIGQIRQSAARSG